MIGAGEVSKRAGAAGVDARTVERDYILTHVAVGISAVAATRLVLKGGTSLRLAHFADYRFSADLDYSAVDIDLTQAVDLVRVAIRDTRARAGLSHLELLRKPGGKLEIEYVGPLKAKPRVIEVDIAIDEEVLEPQQCPMSVTWRDVDRGCELHVYSLREVCAEKLRCIIQRRQCRDLFDLWILVEREQQVSLLDTWPLFEAKARSKEIVPYRFFAAWKEREPLYRRGWEAELAAYIGDGIPNVDAVLRQMNRRVGELRTSCGESR